MKFLFFLFFLLSFASSVGAFDATYYNDSFEGKRTTNGDIFSQDTFTVASCSKNLGSYGYAYTASTGVVLKMNDRIGGCSSNQDKIDLSKGAFSLFAPLGKGVIKNLSFTGISTEENLPIRKFYSENTFSSLGVILSQKIANTYFIEDGIVVSGRVTDGGSSVIFFLQRKDIDIPVYSNAFPVINGKFSISLKFPKEAGEYDFVLLSSSQIQNNIFSIKGSQSIFLIEPGIVSYPKQVVSSLKSPPKYINSKTSTPYLSFGDSTWGVLRIEQDRKATTATGQVFMPDMYGFRTGQARFYFSGSSLSTVSSLDQNPVLLTSSGFIFLDKIRYNTASEDKVRFRILKNAVIFRFKIPRGEKIEPRYYITLPNGDVLMKDFDKKYIDPENSKLLKSDINITATFPIDTGIYRLEVNNNKGFAYFNIPVYAKGVGVPILKTISDSDVGKIITNIGIVEKDIVLLINQLRSSLGRGHLIVDSDLSKIAQEKANYMRDNDDLNHITRDGRNIDDFAKTLGFNISGLPENIAGGNVSHLVLQDGLEESGSHRLSMINPKWKKIGVGYAIKNKKAYLVQTFSE